MAQGRVLMWRLPSFQSFEAVQYLEACGTGMRVALAPVTHMHALKCTCMQTAASGLQRESHQKTQTLLLALQQPQTRLQQTWGPWS